MSFPNRIIQQRNGRIKKLRRYMSMNKMIAYCGLDCEKCDAYLATINDDHELRRKTAKLGRIK